MTEFLTQLSPRPSEARFALKRASSERQDPLRVLVISTPFPSNVDPTRGIFVKERVKALAQLPGVEVRVISPVPWFPPIKRFSRWYAWSQYPREELFEGLRIYHPRYLLLPKVGGYIHPQLMYPAVRRTAKRLRREGFPFDIVDAHFVYPNGVVGAKLGRRYGVPVVMTGRGEDMLRFPAMRFKGRQIRWALRQAAHCVALSGEIAEAMQRHGADPGKITVIPNGVDTDLFKPLSKQKCRRQLGLPADAKIILSVGDRLELKGFHILVDALPELLRRHPNSLLVIVGGPGRHGRDYTAEIMRRIEEHGVQEQVRLVGPRPHEELPLWYNAADVFALLSSREGSPNVLLEALACGTPAVGTPVGGIADELESPQRGVLLSDRTPSATAAAISAVFRQKSARHSARRPLISRNWTSTIRCVLSVLRSTM